MALAEGKILADKAVNIAVEARTEVAGIKQKVDSHEELCALRYETINTTMQEIKESISENLKRIYGKVFTWLALSCGGMFMFVIGLLIYIFEGKS